MKPRQAFLRAIRSAHTLDVQVRYLALELGFRATENGLSGEASVKELAQAVGTTERSVERWLATLTKGGWFRRTGKRSWCLVPPATVVHTDTDGGLHPTPVSGQACQGPTDPDTGVGTGLSDPDTGVGQDLSAPARVLGSSLVYTSETKPPSNLSRKEFSERTGGGGVGENRNFENSDSGNPNGNANGSDSLAERARGWLRDPVQSGFTVGSPATWREVGVVATYFETKTGRPIRLTAAHPGILRLVDRFAEGYTVAEVCRAIDGALADPWFTEHPQHQTLQTILRDPGQVERFRDLANSNRPPPAKNPRGRPVQPTYADDAEVIESKHEVLRS